MRFCSDWFGVGGTEDLKQTPSHGWDVGSQVFPKWKVTEMDGIILDKLFFENVKFLSNNLHEKKGSTMV